MSVDAVIVADLGIGSHLGTTASFGPVFGSADQTAAYAAAAVFGNDKPAFQIADVLGIAILDKRANADLEKADQVAISSIGDEDELEFGMLDDVEHFVLMIVVGGFVPEQFSQTEPLAKVFLFERTNNNFAVRH